MNREEAIAKIQGLLDDPIVRGGVAFVDQPTLRSIQDALRGPQPDPDTGLVPCDYCNKTYEQKPLFHENNYEPHTRMMSIISIEENNGKHQIEIDLWDGGNVYAAFEINYCPMCGRNLEERQ